MMKFFGLMLLLMAVSVKVQCNDGSTFIDQRRDNFRFKYQPPPPIVRRRMNNIISRQILKLALDLSSATSNKLNATLKNMEQNVVLSPLSFAGTKALVSLFTGEQLSDEALRKLGLDSDNPIDKMFHTELMHRIFGSSLIEQMKLRKENSNELLFNYANGIFVQNDYKMSSKFKEISQDIYKSDLFKMDFRQDPLKVKNFVNEWVSNKTVGKIRDVLKEPLSRNTKSLLASVLYFNGKWTQAFVEDWTQRERFFINPGQSIEVDMMFNDAEFMFNEDNSNGVKIIGLPYKSDEVTMYIVLPAVEGTKALLEFQQSLTPEYMENLINNMHRTNCIVKLPKMNLSSSLDLTYEMQSLSLGSLVAPDVSDSSRSSSELRKVGNVKDHTMQELLKYRRVKSLERFNQQNMDVDDVIQEVRINIDEKGTEGAAATIAMVNRIGHNEEEFIANRPFLFFIRHNPSKFIMFWGMVNKPQPYY